jgi:hypothetical protein
MANDTVGVWNHPQIFTSSACIIFKQVLVKGKNKTPLLKHIFKLEIYTMEDWRPVESRS